MLQFDKKVGNVSMKVNECMSSKVCCCTPDAKLTDVAKLMCENHVGCIPVCDDNQCVVGVLTDRDIILRSIACDKEACNTNASECMTTKVCCCSPEASVEEATKLMSDFQIRRIPVVQDNKIVGILSLGDIANHQKISSNEVAQTVENICNCNKKQNAE